MQQILVNGGMNPGNSGGPVVDARGVICGVAVAGIPGTNINFAVPSEKVQRLIGGRVYDLNFGAPYRSEGELKIQAKMSLHDPLNRLKKIRLDVWSGSSAARPTGSGPPAKMAGDSPVKTVEVVRELLEASTDFALPPLDGGKVLWTALATTDDRGQTHWQPATYYEVSASDPYDRVPTTLALKRADSVRTLKVLAKQKLEFTQGKQKASFEKTLEVDVLETIKVSGTQTVVRMDVGNIQSATAEIAVNGEKKARPENPRTTAALKNAAFQFTLDKTGTLAKRMVPSASPTLTKDARYDMDEMINALENAFEVGFLQVPDRRMEANDSWTARMPMVFAIAGSSRLIPATMVMQCLYEGQRKQGGTTEAYVRLIGTMESGAFISGTIRGHAIIDVGGGYIAKMHAKMQVDFEQGNTDFSTIADVEITRTPGNTKGIAPGAAIAAGKELLKRQGQISAQDPIDEKQKGHAKFFEIDMEAGKTYVIEMRAPAKSDIDPFLRLEDPNGKQVAEDDDSGGGLKGLDAQIVYRATETGKHKIIATTHMPDQVGDFFLYVTEYAEPEAMRKE